MRVPTEAEWGGYQGDLDQDYAHKRFAGRTNQEMVPHFRRNLIESTGELRWMPEIPFRYYMHGFRDFVMAGEFEDLGASDAAVVFSAWSRRSLNNRTISCQSCLNYSGVAAPGAKANCLWRSEEHLRKLLRQTGSDRKLVLWPERKCSRLLGGRGPPCKNLKSMDRQFETS